MNARKARHSSKSDRHFSPQPIVAGAHATMGAIDVDPASEPVANTGVRARRIFTREQNGLIQSWAFDGRPSRVFLNPPGGVDGEEERETRSRAKKWWFALAKRWEAHEVSQAIFIGFSIEILQVTQSGALAAKLPVPMDFPLCIPAARPDYLKPVEREGRVELVPQGSPTHAGVVVFLPPRGEEARKDAIKRFFAAFSPVGRCKR